ncbi:MAG: hypothetical protein FWG08_01820 [Propionibacteriaceae bacterium]|nr:hypothetical protein [Propionibacteriaceae bacterium]
MTSKQTKRYRFTSGDTVVDGDTLTDLVAKLEPGYDKIPGWYDTADDEFRGGLGRNEWVAQKSFEARMMCAEKYAWIIRDFHTAIMCDDLGVDWQNLTREQRARAIAESFTMVDDDDPKVITEDMVLASCTNTGLPVLVGAIWPYPYPIVGVTTSFINQDGSFLPFPTGNVILVDPMTDSTLLRSLQDAKLITLTELPPHESAQCDTPLSQGWNES